MNNKAIENLKLWNDVQRTDPSKTEEVGFGRKFTSIDAYSQIMAATEQFGSYGTGWGFESIELTFIEPFGMAVLKGMFFYKYEGNEAKFPVTNSILMKSEKGKLDDDFAKKMETDAITKALSRLGFNADVFMGKFNDQKYVAEREREESALERFELKAKSIQTSSELEDWYASCAGAVSKMTPRDQTKCAGIFNKRLEWLMNAQGTRQLDGGQ